jgi:hypothetical protein
MSQIPLQHTRMSVSQAPPGSTFSRPTHVFVVGSQTHSPAQSVEPTQDPPSGTEGPQLPALVQIHGAAQSSQLSHAAPW